MTTRQAATNSDIQLKLDGTFHKLNVTVRHNDGIDNGKLVSLIKATISLWCKAWQATQTNMRDWTTASPCEQVKVEPSADDPFVTVWNKSNGQSLTVHSNTNGATAILPFFVLKDAHEAMIEAAPEMFSLSQSTAQPAPNNITHMPQQQQQNQTSDPNGALQLNAWSRSTIEGLAPGLLGFESGKTDSPNYDKQAIVATMPYDWKAVQFDKKYSFAAYPTTGKVVIKDFDNNGVFSIGIETSNNATIWVKDRGGEHNYDWMAVTKKLGIDDKLDQLRDGFEGHIQTDYVVMSLSKPSEKDGQPVQYKNFYGFFNAPETQELAATGTEGKVASDSEWLEQNKATTTETDYSDIPF